MEGNKENNLDIEKSYSADEKGKIESVYLSSSEKKQKDLEKLFNKISNHFIQNENEKLNSFGNKISNLNNYFINTDKQNLKNFGLNIYDDSSQNIVTEEKKIKEEAEIKSVDHQRKDENKNIIINNYNIYQTNNIIEISEDDSLKTNPSFKPKKFIDEFIKKRERNEENINETKHEVINLENKMSLSKYMDYYNFIKETGLSLKFKKMIINKTNTDEIITDTNSIKEINTIEIEWCNLIDKMELPKWTYLESNLVTNKKILKFLGNDIKQIYCSCTDKCNNVTDCPCARFNYLFNGIISYNYEIKKKSQSKTKKQFNKNSNTFKKISSKIKNFEIFECGNECSCDKKNCSLSLVNTLSEPSHWILKNQFYVNRIKKSANFKGKEFSENMWGLFTKIDIPKNCYVLEYLGQVITNREAEERGKIADNLGLSYLFDMNEPNTETIEKYLKASGRTEEKTLLNSCLEEDDFPLVVDASDHGNLSRFINHSCDPNLKTQLIHVEYIDPRYSKIVFFTKKEIKANSELTFDYSYQGTLFGKDIPCLCESKKCRGLLVKKWNENLK